MFKFKVFFFIQQAIKFKGQPEFEQLKSKEESNTRKSKSLI